MLPVVLPEHDAYRRTPADEDAPVAGAVEGVLAKYRERQDQ